MKKIGLTLDDDNYQFIKEIAKQSGLTVTTICSLIIKSRISWYEEKNYIPVFGQKYFERIIPNDGLTDEERTRIAKTPWLE